MGREQSRIWPYSLQILYHVESRRRCLWRLPGLVDLFGLPQIGDPAGEVLIPGNDALTVATPRAYDCVLANPFENRYSQGMSCRRMHHEQSNIKPKSL